MKLYAISDLHLGYKANRQALEQLPACPEDWLILGGDVGETAEHLALAFRSLIPRFRQIVWVPGNHELWTTSADDRPVRGQAKYQQLVSVCRSHGVLTPEDPYPVWTGEGGPCVLAPLFLLYDYSFRPAHIPTRHAVAWARESGVLCVDEKRLSPAPYPSIPAWCQARCRLTEERLVRLSSAYPLVLVNHFPLRQDLIRLAKIPRFTIWCGTTRTEDWHQRFPVLAVVSGHLHMRATDWRDGVRFEEVSLGYPRHWKQTRGIGHYVRQILPGPPAPPDGHGGPQWHR